MANNDLTSTNVPYNPINPGVAEQPSPASKSTSAIDTVLSAFQGMKETASEGIQQFKALVKSEPKELTKTDVKTGNAVSNFFSKTIPDFGKSLLNQVSSLKERVDDFVNKDKKYEAEHNKYLPAWAAGGDEKLSASDKLSQAAKPLTRRMSQLSEASKPALAAIGEKVDALRSIIPSITLSSKPEVGDDLGLHVDMESGSPRKDINSEMPGFLSEVNNLASVKFGTLYNKRMQDAHAKLNKELGVTLDNKRTITYDAGLPPHKAWNIKKLSPNKTYDLNGVKVKGSALLDNKAKTRVTYDKNVVDPQTLAKIMKDGATTHEEQVKASGRCVVSTDILTHDNNGIARAVDKNNPATFQTYTVNAPNIAYNPKIKEMMSTNGKVDIKLWQNEMTRLFTHVLKEAQKDNLEMIVIPALGMGKFMEGQPPELKEAAKQALLNALSEAKKAANAQDLQIVVTGPQMEGVESNDSQIHIVGGKDPYGVLGKAIDKNFRVGLVNAGDPSGQTGQYANIESPQDIALEESLVINAVSVRINQNYNSNNAVGDPSTFIAS